jgi:hypothetical protein
MERDDLKSATTLCSKRDCCPVVKLYADGSASIVDDDGPIPMRVDLDPQQVAMLKIVLDAG